MGEQWSSDHLAFVPPCATSALKSQTSYWRQDWSVIS